MEVSDGQKLWNKVGGEKYMVKRRKRGTKEDTQLSVQFTMSSSNEVSQELVFSVLNCSFFK